MRIVSPKFAPKCESIAAQSADLRHHRSPPSAASKNAIQTTPRNVAPFIALFAGDGKSWADNRVGIVQLDTSNGQALNENGRFKTKSLNQWNWSLSITTSIRLPGMIELV
jgi:hypothetical protein